MAPGDSAGYSGVPLAQKLGIKDLSRVYLIDPPEDYEELLEPLPSGVTFVTRLDAAVDVAHVFVTRKRDLIKHLGALRKKLRPDAAVWVSWPKKTSPVATEVTEDTIREVALPIGFVDVKVCAVSDIWSGLKLVVRKELR